MLTLEQGVSYARVETVLRIPQGEARRASSLVTGEIGYCATGSAEAKKTKEEAEKSRYDSDRTSSRVDCPGGGGACADGGRLSA